MRTYFLLSFQERPVVINERLMTWRIPLEYSTYATLFSAYAPTLASSEAYKDCFYNSLASQLSGVPFEDKIVVLVDFNARVGAKRDVWSGIMGPHGVCKCNDNFLRANSHCGKYAADRGDKRLIRRSYTRFSR